MSVENAGGIDAMVLSQDNTQISLVAVEQRPLRDDAQMLRQVNEKLGAYMHALDSAEIPEAQGRLVSLMLIVPNEPRTPAARELLEQIHQQCVVRGEGFTVRVQTFPDTYAELIGMSDAERQPHDPSTDAPASYPVVRDAMGDAAFEAYLDANADPRMAMEYHRQKSKRASGESRRQRFRRMLGGE